MTTTNPKVDAWFDKPRQWNDEALALRTILLGCGLSEELKWYKPCYAFDGSNVAIVAGFKEYCALSFFKGALLADPAGVLDAPGENSRAARLIRFTSVEQIGELAATIRAYVLEAIELEKAGRSVDFAKDRELPYPEELRQKFAQAPELKSAFEALTPGRQREYLLHFSGAKQSATRTSRIEKAEDRILAGRGMRDR